MTPSPHNTLESVCAQLNDYQKIVTHQSISALPYRPPTLIPPHTLLHSGYPHDSSVKLNCDDAFKNLSAAFCIVTFDSTGLLSYSLGNRFHDMSPLHAKIIAVHYACSLAFNHGCFNAIVESDSQIAISLSSLDMPLPWSLAALVDDIRLWAKYMYI
nr:Myc-type, basic helix-loop-helix (bHLH) domain-containing protein [Tanacetum cinerariifolium]